MEFSLNEIFQKINEQHFDGFLDPPTLRWNSRLRTSAGRFIPGSRKFWRAHPPVIEVASYLMKENGAQALIADTIGHEMIHYWLWIRKKPYGHTGEFWSKMNEMGVSRYNSVPQRRPHRYLYKCPACETEFRARRKLGILACAKCCKQHADGRFDSRFKLFLEKQLERPPIAKTLVLTAILLTSSVAPSLPMPAHAFGSKSPSPSQGSSAAAEDMTWVSQVGSGMQCAPEGASTAPDAGSAALRKVKVNVLETRKSDDGKMHIQLCETPSGTSVLYRIRKADLAKAMSAGFQESHLLK